MKTFVGILLGFAVLLAIALPVVYYGVQAQLPPLATREDVRAAVAPRLETLRAKRGVKPPFQFLTRAQLAESVIPAWLALHQCPRYLDAKLAEGDFVQLVRDAFDLPPRTAEEACDREALYTVIASGIADEPLPRALAARKLRAALTPTERLLALLSTGSWGLHIRGADLASRILIGRDLKKLDPARAAELALAASNVDDYLRCENQPMIRNARDEVLKDMAQARLLGDAALAGALREPVSCNPERLQFLEHDTEKRFGD